MLQRVSGTPLYLLGYIRTKNNKEDSRNQLTYTYIYNPNTWPEIKEVFLNLYGDKKDLNANIRSILHIKQYNKPVTSFYKEVKSIETAMKSSALATDEFKNAASAINKFIGLLAKSCFDGLHSNVALYVQTQNPNTLEDALEAAKQYSHAHNVKEVPLTETKYRKPQYYKDQVASTSRSSQPLPQHSGASDDVSMRTHHSRMQINTSTQKSAATSNDYMQQPNCMRMRTKATRL